jgi:hypothetical protein
VTPEPSIVIARGARAAEAFLLAELRRLHEAARADWSLLARPVRVLVPSRSLRDHLAAELVRAFGGGAAGIAVQTLRALAFELLERAGEGVRGGQALVPVLVRRFAAAEPALERALGGFDDGFAAALASVNDLLDAGLDATNAGCALDCLAEAPAPSAARARAEALVRVTERVAAALAEAGREPRAGFFRRARERFQAAPALLPARALYLHGWADVTGVQLDLIEALVRGLGGCVVLDHPPGAAGDEPGEAWTERLRLRLGGTVRRPEAPAGRPALDGIEAPGLHAEARAVADRIRALLDGGLAPESIGIVLRDPEPSRAYGHALHAQLGRVGVPFSGGPGALGPSGRRIAALLELLERGDGCPADRWLDAQVRHGRLRTADLRLAFHGIGVGRLRDVAALDLDRILDGAGFYALPVRRGLVAGGPEAGGEREAGAAADEPEEREAEPEARISRRKVSRDALAGAAAEATAVCARIAALRGAATLGAGLAGLRGLLAHELGWTPAMPAAAEVRAALGTLEQELGAGTALAPDELLVALRRALAPLGRELLGGQGGGVALLSALEARGRTFERLFVMGLSRDVFPRLVREDPLLPDSLRCALEAVLPDVPVKRRGEDEERYLFAALCNAAPAVTLSWPLLDDDGKERAVSPLVEALRTSGLAVDAAPSVLEERRAPRPAFEHALRAGVAGARAAATHALGLALGSPALAQARSSASALLDVGGWPEALSPFFGFVGGVRPGDPRSGALSITRLEGLARCAWQAFLERVLGLEPPPDALAELPDASPRLVGNVVHAVLEELVADAGGVVGGPIADALARRPVRVAWPDAPRLEAKLLRAAERAAREEGIVLRGFAVHLAQRARPVLERVRALEWADGEGPPVLGAELEGAVAIASAGGGERAIRFRADRADLVDGALVLVDYKAGAPISEAKQADTRQKHLLAQIARGRRLQGPAYARAAAEGRYVFANPEIEDASAVVAIAHDDPDARARFEEAARDLLAAFERGAFPPRLLGEKRSGKGPACERCDVAEACLQGETGSARHLAAWLTKHEHAPERLREPAERAALALLLRVEKK